MSAPNDIDTVFVSHLHADHVGWNIDPETSDVPTFKNARYTVHRADWEHFTVPDDDSEFGMEPIERSVIPLDRIGVLDLMEGETELAPGVTAILTPGHTPGHMALTPIFLSRSTQIRRKLWRRAFGFSTKRKGRG